MGAVGDGHAFGKPTGSPVGISGRECAHKPRRSGVALPGGPLSTVYVMNRMPAMVAGEVRGPGPAGASRLEAYGCCWTMTAPELSGR